jgi:hypothetical protein
VIIILYYVNPIICYPDGTIAVPTQNLLKLNLNNWSIHNNLVDQFYILLQVLPNTIAQLYS